VVSRPHPLRRVSSSDSNYTFLLTILGVFMALLPFLGGNRILAFLMEGLLFLALVAGAWTTRTGTFVRSSIIVVGVGIFLESVFHLGEQSSWIKAGRYGLQATALLVVTISIVKDVLGGGKVDANRVMGSACIYLLFGIIWSNLYTVVEVLSPGAFKLVEPTWEVMRFDLWYFSMVTLTTLGYGDITPIAPMAKSLAVVEAVTGQLILVILVARTVGLHTSFFAEKEKGKEK